MSGKKVSRNKCRKNCKNLAHNLKVVGSNPTPATKIGPLDQRSSGLSRWRARLAWRPAAIGPLQALLHTRTRAGRASAAPGSALNQVSSFNHSGEADRCAAQLQRFWHFWH
jgi:hypothetical protein